MANLKWHVSVLVSFFCILFTIYVVSGMKSKYSAEVNMPNTAEKLDFHKDYTNVDNPFRMQKINMLWQKAKKRLPENKLKLLYVDLKSQDKDELLLKKLKSEGQDKTGTKENSIRKQLTAIIKKYGLSDPWVEPLDNETAKDLPSSPNEDYMNKQVFKDKKLNKLWLKAEQAGFNNEEIETLREEFQHHQDKIDQYYMLMDRVNEPLKDKDDIPNSVDMFLDDQEQKPKASSVNAHQLLKEKHRDLKENYSKLTSKVSGSDSKQDFEVHAVQNLWEMALNAGFTPSELNSLRSELHHYENRILKLRFFQSELDVSESHGPNKVHPEKPAEQKHLFKKVKEFEYKVNKIHNELESRIMQRHSEL